jgi:TonB family protein
MDLSGPQKYLTICLLLLAVTVLARSSDTDRDLSGLVGPVKSVRTETAKIFNKNSENLEGPRSLLEMATYDQSGKKISGSYFPVAGTVLTGREVYKYDSRGNLIEMVTITEKGEIVNKEVYTYEFDSMGNWTRMVTYIANSETDKSPRATEVTYRRIEYFSLPSESIKNETLVKQEQPRVEYASTVRPKPPVRPVSGGVLNGKALTLPKPSYPAMARRTRVTGEVTVEVVIDMTGGVVSARAIEGPTVFHQSAVKAAYLARFSPAMLENRPVMAIGRITYIFHP